MNIGDPEFEFPLPQGACTLDKDRSESPGRTFEELGLGVVLKGKTRCRRDSREIGRVGCQLLGDLQPKIIRRQDSGGRTTRGAALRECDAQVPPPRSNKAYGLPAHRNYPYEYSTHKPSSQRLG